MSKLDFNDLLVQLRISSGNLQDASTVSTTWPDKQLRWMADAGVLGWLVPTEFGGSTYSQSKLVRGYLDLASACLPSTFVLTQRNAAIQRIVKSPNEDLKADLLPELTTADLFATVGISHLTTSRQHWNKPTVEVELVDAGFIFNGDVPWVTGADQADYIVTGGTLPDGKQVLVAVDTNSDGVRITPPVELMALNASRTSSVRLEQVFVPDSELILGPSERVMQQGGAGAGSYTTSALALGHAKASLGLLEDEASRRRDLSAIVDVFAQEIQAATDDLLRAISDEEDEGDETTPESMRQRSNSLALRTSQACLAASKGSGFVAGHRASQLVREAMFFLVWSCPQPVVMANLEELAGAAR